MDCVYIYSAVACTFKVAAVSNLNLRRALLDLCLANVVFWYRRATLSFQICTEQLWYPVNRNFALA